MSLGHSRISCTAEHAIYWPDDIRKLWEATRGGEGRAPADAGRLNLASLSTLGPCLVAPAVASRLPGPMSVAKSRAPG